MGRPKRVVEEISVGEDGVEEIVAPSQEEKIESIESNESEEESKDSITLVSTGKDAIVEAGYSRTFSKAMHGKDWKKAAEAWKARYC